MFDLLAVAYQTNMTRIATFMMVAEVSNMSYAHIGVPDAFHPLSHHADNKTSLEKLAQVQRYHSQVFADFLAKLAATPDGDAGSMLDSSVFLYGSNMSNSNQHDSFPLPTLVVGGANGAIKGNQHLRVRRPHADSEPALHVDAACRRARRQSRRQHRRDRGGLMREHGSRSRAPGGHRACGVERSRRRGPGHGGAQRRSQRGVGGARARRGCKGALG